MTFSDFMADVDCGKVEQVTIAGHEIAVIYRTDKESFRTYAPSQYDGLAHKLIERGISVTATEPTQSSLTSLLYSWAPILLLIGVLMFFVRQMPPRRQRAALVRPEQGQAVVQLAKEGDL